MRFADGVRRILSSAVHATVKPERARKRALTIAGRALFLFIETGWRDAEAVHIANELRRRFETLFTFLKYPGIPWHNNRVENAIRQGALHRKIGGGRRTWNGAHSLECILSVYRSCRKKGVDFRSTVLSLLIAGDYGARIAQLPIPET
ncbi:MAG: transposase [Nitrososphaerota archaeon]|nr:transposase [Nitrososphaerota archaeon]